MSSRVFQSVVLQMKDSTDRAIGVIDSEGTVVACNDLGAIGEHSPGSVEAVNRAEGAPTRFGGHTFQALNGWSSQFDYAAFARAHPTFESITGTRWDIGCNGDVLPMTFGLRCRSIFTAVGIIGDGVCTWCPRRI